MPTLKPARIIGIALLLVLFFGLSNLLTRTSAPEPSTVTVSTQQLPIEARQTLTLIHQDGPFPYEQDGFVFGNREKLLPAEPRGYYREYTVPTPGANNRGARRIVCGGKRPSTPDRCYYTADHYQSFQFILDENAKP
ncbi:MAG: ribonuclease [Azoarcus sp.]|nr:ribonuclease [Azoarcus sp.]